MGLNCSNLADLESNEYLKRFCSKEIISPNGSIWSSLFSHSLHPIFSKDDGFMLDANIEGLKADLLENNLETKNFASLVHVFITRALELKSSVQTGDSMFIWQAYNALFIVRNIIKYFAENMREEVFCKQFQLATFQQASVIETTTNNTTEHVDGSNPIMINTDSFTSPSESDVLEPLIEALVQILTDLPVKSNTYILHLEAVNTLIVLLSTQMFWAKAAWKLMPFRAMMQVDSSSAPLLTKSLLTNYIEHRNPPYSVWQGQDSGSIVIGVASGIWNILRKGVGFEKPKDSLDALKDNNLASHSLYLLLILINHCTAGIGNDSPNLFRESLITFGNENAEDALAVENPLFRLSYAKLYDTICNEIKSDDTTLLLYMLIHRNSSFRSYIMARSDVEHLVLPILCTLYNAPTSTSHHIYMSLIILLILSEDELFNQQVHDITLKNISWYTGHTITEISLGGLIILVVIRTIQYNILKMRDKYLHTNCLAALANMSSKFRSLHPYVSQRLVSLFETLGKRHSKLLERFHQQSASTTTMVESENASETVQDITVLEEVIRMVLEILNSILTHQVPQNRNLIYTLLYRKTVFDSFREYDATQELVTNIDVVITYFTKRLGTEQKDTTKDLSVTEVMDRIEEGIRHWSPDILKKFPDLKFKYVEENQPEDFFIPYIWSLIYNKCGIHWASLNINLFNAET